MSYWMYGNRASGISGTKYGTLTRITTPSTLPVYPDITSPVAYWVGCRSTNLDEGSANRFYQAAISYDPAWTDNDYWRFSWGYSRDHLGQEPDWDIYAETNHNYELGIRFTGTQVEAYVTDLATSTIHTLGSLPDNGTLYVAGDQPSFLMEGYVSSISTMNVSAFKAYNFNVFLSPSTSQEWPGATVHQEGTISIPAEIGTTVAGTHQYYIGNVGSGYQLDDGTPLWS